MAGILERLAKLKKDLTWTPLPEIDLNSMDGAELSEEESTQLAMDLLSTTPIGGAALGTKLIGTELLSSLKDKFSKMYPTLSSKGDTFTYPLSNGLANTFEKTPTLSESARKKILENFIDLPNVKGATTPSFADILGDIPKGYEHAADVRFGKLPDDVSANFQAMFYPSERLVGLKSVEDILNPARRTLDHELGHAISDRLQPAESKFYRTHGALSPEINKLRRMPQEELINLLDKTGKAGADRNGPLFSLVRELRNAKRGSAGSKYNWEGRPEEMFAEFVGGAPRTELSRRFDPGINSRPILDKLEGASFDDILNVMNKESYGNDLYDFSLEELLRK